MKTIAVISNTTWSIVNFRKGLIVDLVANGYKVIALGPPDYFSPQVAELGCKYIPLQKLDQSGTNPINDLSLIGEFRKIFKSQNVDYAILYTIKPNVYGSLATFGIKTKTLATVNGLGYTFYKKGIFKAVIKMLYRVAFSKASRVIFQNPDDQQFFIENSLVKKEKTLNVKGSGVDLEQFRQNPTFRADSDKLIFMMSARLVKEKGILEYYEAAKTVKTKYPNIQFLLYGIASNNPSSLSVEDVKKLSEEGEVDFKGVTLKMSDTLESIDVLVLPSYYREGIPRVLLEGLSKGLPLITCDSVGCKETVENGKNGYLVEPKSADALAEAIIKMIEIPADKRKEMGSYSRKKAETEFSEKKIISTYIEEIENLETLKK